jgi:isopenicillin-N N-acyltransferase like protein
MNPYLTRNDCQARGNLYLSKTCLVFAGLILACLRSQAEDKPSTVRGEASAPGTPTLFARPVAGKHSGQKVIVGEGDTRLPLVVVRGTPYEMGRQLGEIIRQEAQTFLPAAIKGIAAELKVTEADLVEVWGRTAAFADDRVEQELAGLADGSGLPLSLLQAAHAVPLLMPYSCSSIAVWGNATVDGHLYQTRNLDWSMKVGAHNFPVIVMYLPDQGIPHVIPTFAGIIGAHTGMNMRGIALAEMGDAPGKEAPYQVHAPHFTIFFRTMLYDADSLSQTLKIFQAQPMTKRYHFVFGDGQQEHRAVKIRAHAPDPAGQQVAIWSDNDPKDEFAPNISTCLVYNDEGRGAFPWLQKDFGKLDGEKMVALANKIPIKGGNVVNIVYDATALQFWVSYAKGTQEAYLRPYVHVDLKAIDSDGNGVADLEEHAKLPLASNQR